MSNDNPACTQISVFQSGPLSAGVDSYQETQEGRVIRIGGLHCILTLHVNGPEDAAILAASLAEAVRKHTAGQFAALPVTDKVDPIGESIEAGNFTVPADFTDAAISVKIDHPTKGPMTLAEAVADPAAFVAGMTETQQTHAELPDHLKPPRKPLWDRFEAGYVPDQETVSSGYNDEYCEFTRWQMAGGKVKP